MAISPYNILSATFVPIHAFSESIKQLDVMLLSHTQHHGVLGVAQLQNCHLHIGNGVARLVEVIFCCLVQVGILNISQDFNLCIFFYTMEHFV